MAADRRTLSIAALAMALLILIGVVSGAVFAGSACDDIGPRPVAAPVAGDAASLAAVLPALDRDTRSAWQEQLEVLETALGPVVGLADADGTARLRSSSLGPVAVGESVVQLDASGSRVLDAVAVGSGTVVGGGDHLYTLALPNPLTGQVDALQPLDADLGGLTCVDTALVGSPLAFHLDATDGQLLLLRLEEDGDDAELELRDPVAGRVWGSDLDLPDAPAGLAGSRLTAGLGSEVIVTATRTGPEDTAPVLTAVERSDGTPRWQVTRDELAAAGIALPDDGPTRAEVHAVGSELGLVVLTDATATGQPDEAAERDALNARRQVLVTVALADGEVRSWSTLPVAERVVAAATSHAGAVFVTVDVGGGRTAVRELDGSEVRMIVETPLRGAVLSELDRVVAASDGVVGTAAQPLPGGVATLRDGRRVAASGGAVLVLPPADAEDETAVVEVELPAAAVAAQGDGVSLLLLGPDEARVVVTLGG
ncbi:MAG: hypothetical protein ACLFS9_09855 [Nitriliruptoraceae bacterium]